MSVAVPQEEMFSSKCIKHDKPCMIKTGVKDGPNKGKSFLICSNTASPCDHRAAIEIPYQTCSKHHQQVELMCPAVKDNQKRIYVRCTEGKALGKWCFYSRLQPEEKSGVKKEVGRVLQDVNSLPQEKLQEKKSLVVKPKIKSDSAVQPMSDGSSSVAALTQSVIRSAKDPIAARQYIVSEIEKKKNLLRMASRLPDGGQKIKDQLRQLQEALVTCGNADVTTNTSDSKTASSVRPAFTSHSEGNRVLPTENQRLPPHVLREMYSQSAPGKNLYGGRMTGQRLELVSSVTNEALETLHKQLKSCPSAEKETEDPQHLLVSLMTHQRQALTWLLWREKQQPAGGILADDMGLGKTLTMISLVMKDCQNQTGVEDAKPQWLDKDKSIVLSRCSLIVCPASLVHQWAKEIETRCRRSSLNYILYHGDKRERSVLKLSQADIVITTYNLVQKEVQLPKLLKSDKSQQDKPATDEIVEGDGPLARIAWKRVILDEAHGIKNYRSSTALSVCRLRANHRWALTGTPIQNDLSDFYSLLRFLRCSPFDELKVWKKWVENKGASGDERLAVLIRSLLLRRTKDQKMESGAALVPLPEKNIITHYIDLGAYERKLYDQLYKKCENVMVNYISSKSNDSLRSSQLAATNKKIGGDTILLMLLRLRQCCSHPLLTKEELVKEELMGEGVELDLVSAMKELGIQEKAAPSLACESGSDAIVSSAKITLLINKLKEVTSSAGRSTKFVVVSQWTSMLNLVADSLKREDYSHYTIQGDVPPKKRSEMVHDFNTNANSPRVMLVSLRAGGVGLNLIGASHLFIMDLHWNPALELQACDRIYRVGQKNDVVIHKMICKATIEEKIWELQKKKMQLASSVLTGSKTSHSKLTLEDLKSLFSIRESSSWTRFGGEGFM